MSSHMEGRTQAFRTRAGVTGVMKTSLSTAVKVKDAATYPLALAVDAGSLAFGALLSEFTKKPTQENSTMLAIQALHREQPNPMAKHIKGWQEGKRALRARELMAGRGRGERGIQECKEDKVREQESTGAVQVVCSGVDVVGGDPGGPTMQDITGNQNALDMSGGNYSQPEGDNIVTTESPQILQSAEANRDEERWQIKGVGHGGTQRDVSEREAGFVEEVPPAGNMLARWAPSEDEVDAAQRRVGYNPENFHFAIAGKAGCGKSSLINSFLNLPAWDPRAAKVGVRETTKVICRFEDPGMEPPRPWTVWYDVPGAGTLRIPNEEYFKHQALYVFDVLILTIGDRFEKADCQFVETCERLRIPCILVRSKSDQHIENMVNDKLESYDDQSENDKCTLRKECREDYREQSRKMASDELQRAGLAPRHVFCVSKAALRRTYNSTLTNRPPPEDLLDELELVKELMAYAIDRRHSGKDMTRAVEPPQLSSSRNVHQSCNIASESAVQETSLTADQPFQQPKSHHELRRVLHLPMLPRRLTAQEVSRELDANNISFSTKLSTGPEVRSKSVVILSFRALTEIPDHVHVFGENRKIVMYEAPSRPLRNSGSEGRNREHNGSGISHGSEGHPSRAGASMSDLPLEVGRRARRARRREKDGYDE